MREKCLELCWKQEKFGRCAKIRSANLWSARIIWSAILKFHNEKLLFLKVVKERDSYSEELAKLSRSATPRPSWKECAKVAYSKLIISLCITIQSTYFPIVWPCLFMLYYVLHSGVRWVENADERLEQRENSSNSDCWYWSKTQTWSGYFWRSRLQRRNTKVGLKYFTNCTKDRKNELLKCSIFLLLPYQLLLINCTAWI